MATLIDSLSIALSRNWWLLLLRGAVAIAFALLTWMQPGITLVALVLLFGIYAVADGVLGVWLSISHRQGNPHWWLLLLWGLTSAIVLARSTVLPRPHIDLVHAHIEVEIRLAVVVVQLGRQLAHDEDPLALVEHRLEHLGTFPEDRAAVPRGLALALDLAVRAQRETQQRVPGLQFPHLGVATEVPRQSDLLHLRVRLSYSIVTIPLRVATRTVAHSDVIRPTRA